MVTPLMKTMQLPSNRSKRITSPSLVHTKNMGGLGESEQGNHILPLKNSPPTLVQTLSGKEMIQTRRGLRKKEKKKEKEMGSHTKRTPCSVRGGYEGKGEGGGIGYGRNEGRGKGEREGSRPITEKADTQ